MKGEKEMKVYEQTILDTIELLQLIIDTSDITITNEDKEKAKELRIEYKKRLSDLKK